MLHTASRLCQHIAPCLTSILHTPSQAVSVYCSLSYKYVTPPAKPIALLMQWLGVAWISHAVAVQPLWVFHHGSRVLLSTQQPRTPSEVIKRHLHEAPIHSPPVAYEKAGCRMSAAHVVSPFATTHSRSVPQTWKTSYCDRAYDYKCCQHYASFDTCVFIWHSSVMTYVDWLKCDSMWWPLLNGRH